MIFWRRRCDHRWVSATEAGAVRVRGQKFERDGQAWIPIDDQYDWICIHCHEIDARRTKIKTAIDLLRGRPAAEEGAVSMARDQEER